MRKTNPPPSTLLDTLDGAKDQPAYGRAGHVAQLLLGQRKAVGAAGVGFVEPDRTGVELQMLGAGLVAGFQKRLSGEHQVMALLGRLIAQEFEEISLVDLVAVELGSFARGIDLDLVDLAGIADRLCRA